MDTKLGDLRELSLYLTNFRELRYGQTCLRQTGVYSEEYKEQLAAIGRQKVAKKNHETTHCCINGTWKEWRQNFISLHCKGPSAIPYHRYNKIQRKNVLQIPRFREENNSPAFLISCILVLIIVFSNLNSCCSKN